MEYLIKNGSERVVDDARSHVSMIKVMRNFYYIDDKGKDEGLNGKEYTFCKKNEILIAIQFVTEQRKLLNY